MLSFEPLHASIDKMVFEILETPPGARRVTHGVPRGGRIRTFRPFKLQSCTRAHMKALFEAIKLPVGNFEISIPATRVSTLKNFEFNFSFLTSDWGGCRKRSSS